MNEVAATELPALSQLGHIIGHRLHFTVTVRPVPKARPRVVNGHAYTPAKTRAFEQAIGWGARQAMLEAGWQTLTGPVMLDVVITGARANADADNLLKAIADGLNGIAYADDRQIMGVVLWRQDKGLPSVRVEIVAIAENAI